MSTVPFTAPASATLPPRITVGFREIPLDLLEESPTNPRTYFDTKYLAELAESIKAHGVVQPIVVRRRPDLAIDRFEIVAGACRYRGSKLAKVSTIPATIRELTDEQVIEIQIIENLQRRDVHPLDEATGYERLVGFGMEVEAIAAKVGKSISYVYQRMQLDKLVEAGKKAFREDKISAGHAVLIARLQPKQQKEALGYCNNSYRKIGVRDLMRWIDENVHLDLHGAPWKKDDAQLLPKAGACTACPKRTGSQPDLFADIDKKDVCTDPACYHAKADAFFALVKKDARDAGQELIEISTHIHAWDDDTKRKGTLYGEEYKEAHKHCEYTRAGVVVSGKGKGGIRQICTNKKCAIHWPKTESDYNSRTGLTRGQDLARKAEHQARRDAVAAVRAKVTKLQDADLRFIAHAILSEMWHDHVKELCTQLGLEPKKIARGYGGTHTDHEAPIRDHIDKAKPAELPALVVMLAASGKISGEYMHDAGEKTYDAMLKRYKVDRKKIKAKILAEIKAKAKTAAARKKAAKAKPVQTSAKKKRAK